MTPELKTLLLEFDSPQIAGVACNAVYGQCKHFAVPGMIRDACKAGLIRCVNPEEKIVDNAAFYHLDLVLTDPGRVAVGLPPVVRDVPAKKKPAKTLF